jgi:hypothetical protein
MTGVAEGSSGVSAWAGFIGDFSVDMGWLRLTKWPRSLAYPGSTFPTLAAPGPLAHSSISLAAPVPRLTLPGLERALSGRARVWRGAKSLLT